MFEAVPSIFKLTTIIYYLLLYCRCDEVYYRMVGHFPHLYLSGGTAGNPRKFNIREEDDFGFDNRRVMIKLPHEGSCTAAGSVIVERTRRWRA